MDSHPDSGIDPKLGTPVKRSTGLFGWNTIYGRAGEHATPYMTRIWFGRLRLHIFYRGDKDPDCHDHPWDFWTFPLTPYVEEVASPEITLRVQNSGKIAEGFSDHLVLHRQVVPALRWSFRPATHTHRVLFAATSDRSLTKWTKYPYYDPKGKVYAPEQGKIITLVWRSGEKRKWGFLKNRDGKYCWTDWKDYVFGGGKDSPCQ